MLGAVDEADRPRGEARFLEGGLERRSHDRARRAEGVAADPEHDGVPRPQHPGRIRQDVRPPLEDEAHDAELGGEQVDLPARMLDRLEDPTAPAPGGDPAAEPFDHAAAELVVGDETGRGAPAGAGVRDVRRVRLRDLGPHGVALEPLREAREEPRDLSVAHHPCGRSGDGGGAASPAIARSAAGISSTSPVSGDDDGVARAEAPRELVGHLDDAVAREHERHSGLEPLELPDGGHTIE